MTLPMPSKLDDCNGDYISLEEAERIAISFCGNHSPSQPVVLFLWLIGAKDRP
jgi:hypothetical protein